MARWHWDGTYVPQHEFLAAAETARVTVELAEWMLRESCSQAAAWWRDGWQARLWLRCPPSVPLAPFGESVLGALAGSGLAPAALILEVASPVLAGGDEVVLRALGDLRERGVRLAVDVSDAGYASLARLSHHPVDLLRIGPGLVAGLGVDAAAETLSGALVRVGRELGLQVAADGIETGRAARSAGRHGLRARPRPVRGGDGAGRQPAGSGGQPRPGRPRWAGRPWARRGPWAGWGPGPGWGRGRGRGPGRGRGRGSGRGPGRGRRAQHRRAGASRRGSPVR